MTLLRLCDKIVIGMNINKIKTMAIMLVSVLFMGCGTACTLTPIEAREIEEIRGTYELVEYYSKLGLERTELIDCFEYFYVIIGDNYVASIVYKDSFGNDYYACEIGCTFKYRSGSTTDINEIKLRFEMPHSPREDGMRVNYLTISKNNTLACVKTDYIWDDAGNKIHQAVYMSVKKVSSLITYDYIEEQVGHEITDIITPYTFATGYIKLL